MRTLAYPAVLGLLLGAIGNDDAHSALIIEKVRGEPLLPRLEQARLARSEARARLDELQALHTQLEDELSQIDGHVSQERASLERARELIGRWQNHGPQDAQALAQARTQAAAVRQAIASPLADLTLARAQGGQSSKVFRLEAVVNAMLDELQSLEDKISDLSAILSSSEEAAAKARRDMARLEPELAQHLNARGEAQADLEQVQADLVSWQSLTRDKAHEFDKLQQLFDALAAEEGLLLEVPLTPLGQTDAVRFNRSWPVPSDIASPAPALVVMPLDGQIVSQFGERQAAPLDRGILIEADPGSRIVAPRAGTVVFAGPFQRYGQLLIIDHGEGYHTLLSGFDWLGVSEQTAVEAGQLVGSLASDRQGNSRLYLELRRRGKPSNPLPWLAAREDRIRG